MLGAAAGVLLAAQPGAVIPLSTDVHLTFDGEARLRVESYDNPDWRDTPDRDDAYTLLRAMPSLELSAGSVRAFVQAIAAVAPGVRGKPGPAEETGIDLLQSYAELRAPVGNAQVTVRAGRQLLAYGLQRLIGTRYGPNVPQPFDAALARLETGRWRLDAFYARPVDTRTDDLNDRTSRSRGLWSIYATRSSGPGSGLDLYYIGYDNDQARFDAGEGRERRHTLGARHFGASEGWSWDVEAMAQFGRFGRQDIAAWSLATQVRRAWQTQLAPFVELRANLISGDTDPDDDTLGTFNAFFPRGKYFGEISLIGPYNLVNLHHGFGLTLAHGWEARGAAAVYWRASEEDGLYGIAGRPFRTGGSGRGHYVGTQMEAGLIWSPRPSVTVEAYVSALVPGAFLRSGGSTGTARFVGIECSLQFRT